MSDVSSYHSEQWKKNVYAEDERGGVHHATGLALGFMVGELIAQLKRIVDLLDSAGMSLAFPQWREDTIRIVEKAEGRNDT